VAVIVGIYWMLNGSTRDAFGLTAEQHEQLRRISPRTSQDVVDAGKTLCSMVTDPDAKSSCVRLNSTCGPLLGAVFEESVRMGHVRRQTGGPPPPQELAKSLKRIASVAPLCGAQMKTEGTTYSEAFQSLVAFLAGNPDLRVQTTLTYLPGRPDLAQIRPYLVQLGLSLDDVNIILRMVSDMAHLIPQ
jgi:hypothetical protein